MRVLIVSILFILYTLPLLAQQSHAFPAFEKAPLREVLLYLEANHDLVFSYRDNYIDEENISTQAGNFSLQSFLPIIFKQTNLSFEFIDERHIILTKEEISEKQQAPFCGFIIDQGSGQLLSFANVSLKGTQKGVSASKTGYFELQGITIGDTVLISYVGYQSMEVIISDLKYTNCLTYGLQLRQLEMEPIIVTVYLMDGILQDNKSQRILIKPDKLSVFPGSVEPDILTSIQMIPGIFSADESASGLNIRGGTPDQNLVLFDKIPVYHTGHFFGMISAFNPYIVKDVNVYRSGIGSEFGGRVSGVIDIETDNTPPEKFTLGMGLNLTHGHINTSFPIWKKSGLTISLRRSFTDFWPTPTFLSYAEKVFQGTKIDADQVSGSDLEPRNKFYFTDFNFKWVWNPGKNRFGIDLFSGLNSLDYSSQLPDLPVFTKDTVELENIGSSIYWARDWDEQFSSEIRVTNSTFNYRYNIIFSPIVMPENILGRFSSTNKIVDSGFTWTNTWKTQKDQYLKVGFQHTRNDIGLTFNREEINFFDFDDQQFQHELNTLFGEYHLTISNILDFDLGLRYQRQPIIENDYFEPRVALTARINPEFKLKLSSGKQFQFVSQLVFLDLNEVLFGDKIWVASDGLLVPVIESNNWAGGILFSKDDWQVDLEGYVKELAGITSFSSSFGNTSELPYRKGNSRIRGIDLLVKKQVNKIYRSWFSYTLSQSVYEFPDIIENVFPASHDQRHTLQWVHLINKKPWELAVGLQLGSGLPFTNAESIDVVENMMGEEVPIIRYGSQNGNRLDPYHRLDASLMYHFPDSDEVEGFAGISFINIYNHQNILGKQFLIGDFDENSQTYELLKINETGLKFTPNLVVRLQW